MRTGRLPALRDTPIILFTARQDLKLDVQAVDAGVTLTLRKEFGSLELLRTIERLLGRKGGAAAVRVGIPRPRSKSNLGHPVSC